jgi:hypothetical protein
MEFYERCGGRNSPRVHHGYRWGEAVRFWIDTEFNEYHGALISLALVAEDGREWYGVRYCDDPGWWVREHVMSCRA